MYQSVIRRTSGYRVIDNYNEIPIFSVISSIGGFNYEENEKKEIKQFCCSFGEKETYIEKFLKVKEIESEMQKQNFDYSFEFTKGRAIFWYQPKITKQNHYYNFT